jgi:hypothetical protein
MNRFVDTTLDFLDLSDGRSAEFNPDQERDENGRWTGGGTTGGLVREDVATGKPLFATFYRGTAVGTEEGEHAWLTTDRAQAQNYADAAAKRTGTEPVVTEHKLNASNPIETKSATDIINAGRVPAGHDAVVYWHSGGVAIKSNPNPTPRVWAFIKLPSGRGAEFNPDQERDDHGRWTGGDPQTREYVKIDVYPSDMKDPAVKAAVERVAHRCENVARELGIDPGVIHVVYKEPTPFVVGDKQFKEAGHFDPRDGHIEINAQNTNTDRMSLTMGIAAHEVSHLMYDGAQKQQAAEHQELLALPDSEFKRLLRPDGTVRDGAEAEVRDKYPASWLFAQTTGDSFLGTSHAAQMREENGHSEYAKAYWKVVPPAGPYSVNTAINETVAEVTRFLTHPASWSEAKQPEPKSRWRELALGIMKLHRGRK